MHQKEILSSYIKLSNSKLNEAVLVFSKSFLLETVSIHYVCVMESCMQKRGANDREEDNKAKQWGHQSWEMDGRGARQR